MSDVEELSKATSEVAKFGRTGIEASEKLGRFLARVFDEPVDCYMGMIGDKLEFLRWKRKLRMVEKVEKILEEKGINKTRAILPKFAIPFIVNTSLEEDDDLQDIWCNLIANSLDPNFDIEIRYAFIDIIKCLTSLDAKILKFIYDEVFEAALDLKEINRRKSHMSTHSISKRKIGNSIDATKEEIEISLFNLLRAQCLKEISLEKEFEALIISMKSPGYSIEYFPGLNRSFTLTPLGVAFIEACMK